MVGAFAPLQIAEGGEHRFRSPSTRTPRLRSARRCPPGPCYRARCRGHENQPPGEVLAAPGLRRPRPVGREFQANRDQFLTPKCAPDCLLGFPPSRQPKQRERSVSTVSTGRTGGQRWQPG